mmetsp:Transcript_32282/g.52159  ORF Transcript_32282/g.52159 Transcript_32282/m.52159 type:complete len:332 (-) Transcript_32282:350-1345(-)|eukprot:CAMPEP_0184647972 /NCGR_PEP_ID=MMETSP0308-20130426/5015_1 /TAXON_ID=38269 /ORGANISM="Gloeochaete witrockiana, Strain SAG 46.84" /LENGTH=331 /DNA_ID=CAMNT_0027079425 /DNA_START=158 /DNA_END=1153 /DNA_ORIENTATION=-
MAVTTSDAKHVSYGPLYSTLKAVQPFVLGGASGMLATTVIQPIDMVKVRLQLHGEGVAGAKSSVSHALSTIIKEEGALALYNGLGAAILRQATYTTARLGLFRVFSDYAEQKYAHRNSQETSPSKHVAIPLFAKALCGLSAGGLASIVGVPADLVLTRMQADGTLPAHQRRNYTGVGNALNRIVKEEGVVALWKGAGPTVVRAMAINMAMLASYDQCKEYFSKKFGNGFLSSQLPSSLVSGFLSSAAALPFDFVKTRMQKQRPGPNGVLPYTNAIDCTLKVIKHEGPLAFYKGFWTFYFRIAPHAIITLLTLDYLNGFIKKLEVSYAAKQN